MTPQRRPRLRIDVITIFPEIFETVLGTSMLKRAREHGVVDYRVHQLRDFTTDRHRSVDDRPFGGGPGMVMKPEPIVRALTAARGRRRSVKVILTEPSGKRFDQAAARRLAREKGLIFICGHYEGVDERIRRHWVDETYSIGDYVLTGGELPALVMIDAVVRLLPGVVGREDSVAEESFETGLLDHPHYTRPAVFKGHKVPGVLLSGDHQAIAAWRRQEAWKRTQQWRPDLLKNNPSQNRR